MVLDRQLDLVLAQHRLGELDGALVTLEARLEGFEGIELLVASRGERRVRRHRSELADRANASLVLRKRARLFRRRQADDDAHPVAFDLLAQLTNRLEVCGGQVHADCTETEAATVLEDVKPSGARTVPKPRRLAAHVFEHRRLGLKP